MVAKFPNGLANAMKSAEIGATELARRAGTSKQNVSRIMKGERKMTAEWARMFAPHLKVAPASLFFPDNGALHLVSTFDIDDPDPVSDFEGELPPRLDPDHRPDFPANAIVEADARAGMGPGGDISHVYRRDGDEIETVDPVKPEAWIFPKWFIDTEVRSVPKNLLMIEVTGDSMSPTIQPGTVVLIDTAHRLPSPDGVYAIRDRWGQIQVKRLETAKVGVDMSIRVISDNGKHTELANTEDDIKIVGKVVGGWMRF